MARNYSNKIMRTISVTHAKGYYFKDGERYTIDDDFTGALDQDKAAKAARKRYDAQNLVIESVEVASDRYSMSIDDFVQYATEKQIAGKTPEA